MDNFTRVPTPSSDDLLDRLNEEMRDDVELPRQLEQLREVMDRCRPGEPREDPDRDLRKPEDEVSTDAGSSSPIPLPPAWTPRATGRQSDHVQRPEIPEAATRDPTETTDEKPRIPSSPPLRQTSMEPEDELPSSLHIRYDGFGQPRDKHGHYHFAPPPSGMSDLVPNSDPLRRLPNEKPDLKTSDEWLSQPSQPDQPLPSDYQTAERQEPAENLSPNRSNEHATSDPPVGRFYQPEIDLPPMPPASLPLVDFLWRIDQERGTMFHQHAEFLETNGVTMQNLNETDFNSITDCPLSNHEIELLQLVHYGYMLGRRHGHIGA